MKEKLVSESIRPVTETMDTSRMAMGLPGLPGAFVWHGETIRISRVIREWHDTGPCRHGSSDRYIRKHWFEVEDEEGRLMKIYFERNPRPREKARRDRWRLFSLTETDTDKQ